MLLYLVSLFIKYLEETKIFFLADRVDNIEPRISLSNRNMENSKKPWIGNSIVVFIQNSLLSTYLYMVFLCSRSFVQCSSYFLHSSLSNTA